VERAVPAGKVIHAIADNYATHNFQQIATVNAGNGLSADGHEFLITPWDTAPILAYTTATANLSSIGGPANQTIINGVVQEIDISTGKVLFQWQRGPRSVQPERASRKSPRFTKAKLQITSPCRVPAGVFREIWRKNDGKFAMACSGDRAPCSPRRILSISTRTYSPACVVGALPSRLALRAFSIVFLSVRPLSPAGIAFASRVRRRY